jgi:hypothetical protein
MMITHLELKLANTLCPVQTCGARVFEITYLRVTFVARLLKSIPSTRGSMMACVETFRQSAKLLYMLLFFVMLALLINASIIYYLERGTYHLNARVRTCRCSGMS